MQPIYATQTVSVTELKRNYSAIVNKADGNPVAILNHNKPEAYLLPAQYYEQLLETLEDLEDAKLAQERSGEPFVEVDINEL